MKSVWIKDGNCLRPADDEAELFLSKTKDKVHVLMDARRPRHPIHHKKFFALLKITLDNWPHRLDPISKEALLGIVKIETGHFEAVKTRSGIVKIPASINFESLCQSEFEPLYEKAAVFLSGIIGADVEELLKECAYSH